MWLFIDTSERGLIRLASIPVKGKVSEKRIEGKRGRFVATLAAYTRKLDFSTLKGVVVVEGPGSFSAIRTGVLAANLFARLNKLLLYKISKDQSQDLNQLQSDLVEHRLMSVQYVAPVYDEEPNITMAKQ